jgi:tetratricopeptide (TPR) repeat protein
VTGLSYSGTMTWMHESDAELLRAVDPRALGARVKAARVARGLTQAALTGDGISAGYVSRIESGVRRPTLKVLTELARRLDKPVDQLLRGVSGTEYDEIRLGLDYAELALENGEAQEAERHARDALTRAELAALQQLQARGHYLLGRAYEGLGRLDDAIRELEQAAASGASLLVIHAGIALSRCHRDAGDLTLAIEVGERVQARLPALGLDRTDEAVQLAMAVTGGYILRGDLSQAARLCTDVIARTEEWASPAARSTAYWNASVALSERGQVHDAVALATRALALQSEGNDVRNLARLRLALGRLELRMDQGALPDALAHLSRAQEELRGSSAGVVDLAQSAMALADAHLRSGDAERALELAAEVEAMEFPDVLPERAEAAIIRGQAAWALQRQDEAMAAYQVAIDRLTACDEDRYSAQLWFDLAELLDQIGMPSQAASALRMAARATGLQSGRRLDATRRTTAGRSVTA